LERYRENDENIQARCGCHDGCEAVAWEAAVDSFWNSIIWEQFGAAIDMLDNAITACPDEVWCRDPLKRPEWVRNDVVGFWYVAYHTIFFLDYYLSGRSQGFVPPKPFTADELDPAGLLPERPFTKDELREYLMDCRRKCQETIAAMTDEIARQPCAFGRLSISNGELLLYNMRHVQHHAAQLNLILRQTTDSAPDWVSRANENPGAE
jgi:hypothetical protein